MDFINYDESILPGLAELAQRAFPLHEISIRSLRRVTLEDPNFVPEDMLIARGEKGLLGAVLGANYRRSPGGKAGDKTAYLKMICTSPFEPALMHSLLGKMEDRLRDEGSTKLIYSNFASWHLLPGVDLRYENLLDFLISEGFVKSSECVDYVIDLSAFRVPRRIRRTEEDLAADGTIIRLARPEEKESVRDWVLKKSGLNWSYEVARAIGPAGSGVWVAEDETGIVGFSVYGSLENHWFGPIAVDEKKRKKGLGSVMLFKTLESMKNLGIPRAVIPWTGHLFFYSQIPGIVGLRHYWVMIKDL